MNAVIERQPKKEATPLEIALSGTETIGPVARELEEAERRSDEFLNTILKGGKRDPEFVI